MRKSIPFLIFILFLTCFLSVSGDNWGDYEYIIRDGGAIILSYSGNETTINIPYSFGAYYVTEIADRVFEGNTNITSVKMPGTIERIGDRAFAGCTNMKDLVLSVGLKSIGDEAFLNCESVLSLSLARSIEYIGKRAFGGCTTLTYITDMTGEALKFVGSGAFDDTYWFKNKTGTEVMLGQGYVLLKYRGNEEAPNLQWYILTIAEDAFAGNTSIVTLNLPNYMTSLQPGSISGMPNLKNVTGGTQITYAAEGAFRDLPNLVSVDLPQVELTRANFLDCPQCPYGSETSVSYDPSIPDVTDFQFLSEYNSELDGIIILHCLRKTEYPDGELVIPDYIRGKRVVLIGEGACQDRNDIRKVYLPEYLIGIESWAFAYDENLVRVEFPDNIQYIGADAFNNCPISLDPPVFQNVDVDPRAFYVSNK